MGISEDSAAKIVWRANHASLNSNPELVKGLAALALLGKAEDIQSLAGLAQSLSDLVQVLCGDIEYLLQDRVSLLDALEGVQERLEKLEIYELRDKLEQEENAGKE